MTEPQRSSVAETPVFTPKTSAKKGATVRRSTRDLSAKLDRIRASLEVEFNELRVKESQATHANEILQRSLLKRKDALSDAKLRNVALEQAVEQLRAELARKPGPAPEDQEIHNHYELALSEISELKASLVDAERRLFSSISEKKDLENRIASVEDEFDARTFPPQLIELRNHCRID